MKTLLASILVFTATLSFADVAVYNGFQFSRTTPTTPPSFSDGRVIEVVDLANSQIVLITLNVTRHTKTYSVGAPVNVTITNVAHSRGTGSDTVLANASTTTDATTNVTTIASLLQDGRNAQVIVKGTTATSLPRLLEGQSHKVTTAGTGASGAIAATLSEQEISLGLDAKASQISNNAGDTLASAVTRQTTALAARGFTAAP